MPWATVREVVLFDAEAMDGHERSTPDTSFGSARRALRAVRTLVAVAVVIAVGLGLAVLAAVALAD